MHYVYLIKSKKSEWRYVGYTVNLKQRFKQHQSGLSKATKPYRPFDLIFYDGFQNKIDAKRREKYLKTNQGKRALKLMLKDSWK
ncbi:MAG: hypothetical protein COT81_03510 [Candidatus Buchananbacteria bacterium CG10_big_fil_rev_8_21_14_0_10_42_9]|uniref:GIY-YIG domain-containing protein n=1 Tax=Candidatus Buchananbacteria bacterium CG10_big_fil_rev_8_21_14_0_10_42_9 TaxID=1974526 RepID=A0A2H0W0W9_9BACT|nr:MAG: hypothetical protein COT81_03510 [Candidatus Buchananbacteria bacterium CG10_big_fil_rev_8_21_14_0_10_42_9]